MSTSPDYAQRAVDSVVREERTERFREDIVAPPTLTVNLPGGLVDIDGTVVKTATVRELNGWDEEALTRLSSKGDNPPGRILLEVIGRATVSIGNEDADPNLLQMLYAGDWDALLLGIRISSYGSMVGWKFDCDNCGKNDQVLTIDLERDVKQRELPLDERSFVYEGKRDNYRVGYPKGSAAKRMLTAKTIDPALVLTETLYGSIEQINNEPVTSIDQIRAMPSADREDLFMQISTGAPAVLLEEVTKNCTCGSEVKVPLSLAALFRGRAFAL